MIGAPGEFASGGFFDYRRQSIELVTERWHCRSRGNTDRRIDASDEPHRMVRDAVREFVATQVAPHAAAWDRECTFPHEALRGLAAMGCYGVAVPEQWGGAGMDYLALAVILEEIAAGDGRPRPWSRSTTARCAPSSWPGEAMPRSGNGWCRWPAARCWARSA
jgi:alkylation response protein AidB-like acyl-CoA dehydrogenase